MNLWLFLLYFVMRWSDLKKIFIPATSANIGAGFDCLGIALDLYNIIEFEVLEHKKLVIDLPENDIGHISSGANNLIYKSIVSTLDILGKKTPGLHLKQINNIPQSGGLGSSAACIAGGVAIANEIANSPLDKKDMLKIATDLESHPDNVAPAIYGGFVVACMDQGKVESIKITPPDLKFAAFIPGFSLKTAKARSVLPTELSYKDAVFNISRASLTAAALATGNIEALKVSLNDKMHQPFRKKLIPDYDAVMQIAKDSGCIGSFLSGAGPTIMAIVSPSDSEEFYKKASQSIKALSNNWQLRMLNVDLKGLTIE